LEIRAKGEPVELRAKKAGALLAYLAVEYGRPITRERLATLLWGGTSDERARHNLRQALSKIRRTCGSIVLSEGEALAIDRAACAIDVVEFPRGGERVKNPKITGSFGLALGINKPHPRKIKTIAGSDRLRRSPPLGAPQDVTAS
jgi:DNA-binding SARP family transcriptional activator